MPTPCDAIRVFVGHEHREFTVSKTQLCAASPYFYEKLRHADRDSAMYLPRDTPAMFELFAAWVRDPPSFRDYLDATIMTACAAPRSPRCTPTEDGAPKPKTPSQRLHWALVRLHLFASTIGAHSLQDASMDALQDLYLRRDWDVTPRFISFLYAQCTPAASLRLRRWAVAMVTFSLSSPSAPGGCSGGGSAPSCVPRQFQRLLREHSDFSAEYASHLRKMTASGLDIRVKNPQLRIPANRLRNEERRFAFRQCAFHTHRASVGEGRCPHEEGARAVKGMSVLVPLVIEEDKGRLVSMEAPKPLKLRAIQV